MKRLVMVFLMLMLLCAGALGETLQFLNVTADTQQKHVDFGAKGVRDIEGLCAFLDQLPALERVDMYASKLTREQMDMLFERYPDVFFGWTVKIGDHTVRTDITAFSTLHNRNSRFHDSDDVQVLRYCRNLKALDLGHNAIEDISFLRDLPELRVLMLGRNSVKDISVLSELKELEYVELFSNQIDDISSLMYLRKLKDLNLVNNHLRDIEVIAGMDNLERLWISMNGRLDKEQIKWLKKALPFCEIDSYSHPTGGTWREHARYQVIHQMFKAMEYIPF